MRHNCIDDGCPECERVAEARAEDRRDRRPIEPVDKWGRDADWHLPRGYGGF